MKKSTNNFKRGRYIDICSRCIEKPQWSAPPGVVDCIGDSGKIPHRCSPSHQVPRPMYPLSSISLPSSWLPSSLWHFHDAYHQVQPDEEHGVHPPCGPLNPGLCHTFLFYPWQNPKTFSILVWNIPRFWELDTCFLTKNVTIAGDTTNNTIEEIEVRQFMDF